MRVPRPHDLAGRPHEVRPTYCIGSTTNLQLILDELAGGRAPLFGYVGSQEDEP